jgi:hypothetical protein
MPTIIGSDGKPPTDKDFDVLMSRMEAKESARRREVAKTKVRSKYSVRRDIPVVFALMVLTEIVVTRYAY